jgi:hypothetical protein
MEIARTGDATAAPIEYQDPLAERGAGPFQLWERHMKKLALLVVGLAFVASSAFAFHCPKDMKKIDEALPNAKVSAAQMEEVKKLRAEGEQLHKAGKHQESVDTLAKAMKILGIS